MNYRLSALATALDPDDPHGLLIVIKNWKARGALQLVDVPQDGAEADLLPSRRGSPALVSWQTATRIAIMVELVRLSLSPRDAADAAVAFSHFATLDLAGGPPRPPGALFPDGETALCVWRDLDGSLRRKVLNHGSSDGLGAIRSRVGCRPAAPLIVVDCAAVLRTLAPLLAD